jgi:L-fucose isomerase-like protein
MTGVDAARHRAARLRKRPLRVALVAVARGAFKGDADAVVGRAADWLHAEAETSGCVVVDAPFVVRDAADAGRAALWIAEADLDYVLVLHATFATGDLLAPLLRAARHVGVWAVPEGEGLAGRRPGARPDVDPLPLNSLCGLTMTLSALDHAAVGRAGPVKWFFGAPGDDELRRRWSATTRALHALVALERASVLQIGGTAPDFYRLEERPALRGVRVETMPLETLYAHMEAFAPSEVEAHAAAWLRDEPHLEAPFEHFLVAARTDLALTRIAEGGAYDALAIRCWPEFPERCGGMACAAVGALADRGVPTACEGDVMGALSMLALQAVADAPSALMDLSDLDRERDRLLVWHCGNAPRAFAAHSGTRLTTHFNRDGVGVVRDMVLAPGPASAFRLVDGGRRAVIASGTIADTAAGGFDGVRGWWHDLRWDGERRSAHDVVAQMLDERLPHHLALAPGEHTEALHEATVLLGGRVLPARRVRDALLGPAPAPSERGDA